MVFDVEMDSESASIIQKIRTNTNPLQVICDITRGVNPYDKARGQSEDIISNRVYHANNKKDDTFVPEIRGKDIKPYHYAWNGKSFISYGNWLAAPREAKYFEGSRLIMRQVLGKTLFCAIINESMIIDQSIFIAKIKPEQLTNYKLEYLLGVLASVTTANYFKHAANEFDDLFPKIKIGEFRELPIPHATPAQQAEIAALVEQVLAAKAAGEPTAALEAEIDALVAARYGLTPAEVAQLGA
jgi:restriction endonuclease S subunit